MTGSLNVGFRSECLSSPRKRTFSGLSELESVSTAGVAALES
jgi:hypothetical protein